MEEELVRVEREGILEPVTHSELAAPVVPIVKQDGNVRHCGDYKLTINWVACRIEMYPLLTSYYMRPGLSGQDTLLITRCK